MGQAVATIKRGGTDSWQHRPPKKICQLGTFDNFHFFFVCRERVQRVTLTQPAYTRVSFALVRVALGRLQRTQKPRLPRCYGRLGRLLMTGHGLWQCRGLATLHSPASRFRSTSWQGRAALRLSLLLRQLSHCLLVLPFSRRMRVGLN